MGTGAHHGGLVEPDNRQSSKELIEWMAIYNVAP